MKTKYIVFLQVFVALLAGCSEEEIVTNPQQENDNHIVLKAYNGSNEDSLSRLAYTDDTSTSNNKGVSVTWSADDAFYLKSELDENGNYVHGQLNIVEKEAYTDTEIFEGVLSEPLADGKTIMAYYPSVAYDLETNSFQVDIRRSTQKSTDPMAHLSAVNYMVGTGTLGSGVSFSKGNKVAIVRFDMKLPAMKSEVAVSEFQVECENLHTVGTLSADNTSTFVENALLEKHRQSIYLDGYTAGTTETELSVYVTMLPTTLNTDMTVKLLLTDGNVFSSTVSFSNNDVLACNRYYIVKNLGSLIELDYKWYTSLGPDALNYEIKTEGELFAFAKIVNGTAPNSIAKDDFVNQTITLKDDIELHADWTPIGASNVNGQEHSLFKGTFDGNDKIISDLKLYVEAPSFTNASQYFRFGFFGNTDGATIKNLTIRGEAMMERATENNYGFFYLGGFIGRAVNTQVECCRNELDLMGYNLHDLRMGGLVGHLEQGVVKVCSNKGNLNAINAKGTPNLGGIIGYGEYNTIVACCTEAITINVENSGSISKLGGIAGQLDYENKLIGSYSLVEVMKSDAWGGSAAIGGLAAEIGRDGCASHVYGCYAVTELWETGRFANVGNVNVETDMNSDTHMNTLNAGIAAWNATLSGVLDAAYCRYSYIKGESHLVLEKTSGINTGEVEDMENGGEIGKQ